MKTIEVRNYKHFVVKVAKQYNTTVQQVEDIAEELDCTVLCQQRKMYNIPYCYMLISREDIYKILNELEARKDTLQRPEDVVKKRTCKEDKLEWLIDQGAQVDVTDKPNVYTVSMYNGAIIKRFNLNCGMKNIQDYFDRCFCKHKDEDYDEQGKLILKSKRQKQDMSVTPVDVKVENKTTTLIEIIEKEKENINISKTTVDLPNTITSVSDISSDSKNLTWEERVAQLVGE